MLKVFTSEMFAINGKDELTIDSDDTEHSLTIKEGENVSCIIFNRDDAGPLILSLVDAYVEMFTTVPPS